MNPGYIALISLGSLLALAFLIYLFAVKTRNGNGDMKKFLNYKYAHRGFHGEGAEENSFTAYERAIERGYGIEIDIRFSKEEELVVFHDATLERVCGVDKKVSDLTVAELKELRLGDTEDKIPTFSELLRFIDGRVPLLIEIKQDVGEGNVAAAAVKALKDYPLDMKNRKMYNSSRRNIEMDNEPLEWYEEPHIKVPFAWDERPFATLGLRPFKIDGGTGISYENGMSYIFIYWLGRFLDIIE